MRRFSIRASSRFISVFTLADSSDNYMTPTQIILIFSDSYTFISP